LILIVEDHAQMRQFLAAQLSSRYQVVEASNGQEGLVLARQIHPDMILADMMMPVDVNALLKKLGDQTQHMTAKHSVVYHLDEVLPLVQGDQDQLIQVISNVLSNAVKYSPAGGAIVLSSQREEQGIHVSMQDQGIGIAEEAKKDIFAPYSRIDAEKTRYIQGTGLGLSVAHEIINRHGGTIWVESSPGEGSTFHFCLPQMEAGFSVSSEP
jgi:signal transduction histidine kinase